jgi:hypothetical protein
MGLNNLVQPASDLIAFEDLWLLCNNPLAFFIPTQMQLRLLKIKSWRKHFEGKSTPVGNAIIRPGTPFGSDSGPRRKEPSQECLLR